MVRLYETEDTNESGKLGASPENGLTTMLATCCHSRLSSSLIIFSSVSQQALLSGMLLSEIRQKKVYPRRYKRLMG